MHPHVVESGLLLDPPPVVREAGQPGTRLGPTEDPGDAVFPLDAVEHLQDRPGQGHHARTRLRIAQPQHP